MPLWYRVQNAVIINQIIGAILLVVLLLLGMSSYALLVLAEMCIAFAIWWKVVVD